MTGPLSIALQGMTAATARANAAASNIANANTTGSRNPDDARQPYTPVDIVDTGSGPQAVNRDPATIPAYEPDAPYADEQGYVAAPDVDMAREIIDLKQAAQAYKANAVVARVAGDMQKELLDTIDETV